MPLTICYRILEQLGVVTSGFDPRNITFDHFAHCFGAMLIKRMVFMHRP